MPLLPHDPAVVDKAQRELKEQLLGGPVDMSIANLKNIAMLTEEIEIEYPSKSGIWYVIPTIPYTVGLRVLDIHTRIQDSRKFQDNHLLDVYEQLIVEFLQIAWSLMQPKSRFRRILKFVRLLPNPLGQASEGDVGELLAFFLVRRMKSKTRFQSPALVESER